MAASRLSLILVCSSGDRKKEVGCVITPSIADYDASNHFCPHFTQQRWKEKINTHSVSLHSWKSRCSGESTGSLRFKTKTILLRQSPYLQLRCLYLFQFHTPCLGETLLPEGQGHLCLQVYQICRCYPVIQQIHMLPFDVSSARDSTTQICCKTAKKNEVFANLGNKRSDTKVYVHPLQICQGVQGGHEDQRGP